MSNEVRKVVLIGPVHPYRGGIAHFTFNLAQTFMENSFNLSVISYKRQYPKWLYPGKDDKDNSEGRRIDNAEYLFSPLNPFDWKKTLERIKVLKPDLVILQWWTSYWTFACHALLRGLKKEGIHTKVIIHNAVPHEGKKIDWIMTKYALSPASDFLVMNKRERDKLNALFPQASISFAEHPVYRPFVTEALSRDDAKRKLGLDVNKKVGLFFGFIRPYKGLGVLLEAIKILKDEGKADEFTFLVAGEFWEDKSKYLEIIEEYAIAPYLKIHDGYIPDDQAGVYFQAADFFLAPYTGGTQSGALKMALGFGLPCIVSAKIAEGMANLPSKQIQIFNQDEIDSLASSIRSFDKKNFTDHKGEQKIQNSWAIFIDSLTENRH